MIAATGHDRHAHQDYKRLAEKGLLTARDGLRWHLIETSPLHYDFASAAQQITAARENGVRVIWDLFHYGYPEYINIFSDDLPARLAAFGAAFAEFHLKITGEAPFVIPVNEISFFSWIAGEIGRFYPFATGRGDALKRQLAAAAIAAARAIKSAAPSAKTFVSEPLIHLTCRPDNEDLVCAAENYRMSQFQAFDMLLGTYAPELGGGPDIVDALGLNFYPHNQWFYPDREMIPMGDPLYRPLRELLAETASRYDLPLFLSETGTEAEKRAGWFQYVAAECHAAKENGIDLQGICLYPVVNHPGWEDERHCHNGLWDYCDDEGTREIHKPLAQELQRWAQPVANTAARSAY